MRRPRRRTLEVSFTPSGARVFYRATVEDTFAEVATVHDGWRCKCGAACVRGHLLHDSGAQYGSDDMRGSAKCDACGEVVGVMRVRGLCALFAGCDYGVHQEEAAS